HYNLKGMLLADTYSLVFLLVVYGTTFYYLLLSGNELEKVGMHQAEYLALLFFISAGIAIVSSFSNLLMLFLGIEIVSIPLYILSGTDKRNLKSNEASLKYLLMGAFSTGIMLMGIAFVYGSAGTFSLEALASGKNALTPLMGAGLMLLLFSMSFKVSAAPFHFWTPDVYDGAPTVFTGFMASIVKAAAFIAFFRLFREGFSSFQEKWQLIAALITAATLIFGNVTAVFQQSVKRMMAYSSIAQAGFMMLALVALNARSLEGLLYYVTAYSLATIGFFSVLMKLKDFTFEGFNGLARREPLAAAATLVFLFSLAGIPGTAGFMAKFYLLAATMEQGGTLWLIILAVLCAAISVYYYFRVVQAMYFKSPEETAVLPLSTGFRVLLILLALLVVFLGVFPQLLIDQIYMIF
ncbi:MAG: hypothetical protein RL732_1444, partial [Bacteroidota bacterium]